MQEEEQIVEVEPKGMASWLIELAAKGETEALVLMGSAFDLEFEKNEEVQEWKEVKGWKDLALVQAILHGQEETVKALINKLNVFPSAEAIRKAEETNNSAIANFLRQIAEEKRKGSKISCSPIKCDL